MSGIREKQLQKRKQETLDVALRLLMQHGYANLNMDELAEEVGISKPTLYQYFDSKDALASQAVVRMFEKLEEQISELSEKSPLEQLEHLLRSMLKARLENRYVMAPADGEMMRSMVQNYPAITEHRLATKDKLDQIVRKGQALGEIDPSFPSWIIVNTVFSLQRIISNPFAKDEPQRSDAELAEAIESILRLFKQGVAMALPMPT
jgi:TetR/AcrR family transcriptional regulator